MKLAIAHSFAAAPAEVFEALIDPAALRRCIDGCERMEKIGEDLYEVRLKVGVAGMKGTYTGTIRIAAMEPPRSLTLEVDGKGAPGFVRATARLQLAAAGDRTGVSGEADATVGGVVAAVGSRLIEAAAKKMAADFFARLEVEITSRRPS